jgi:hypothetical protein
MRIAKEVKVDVPPDVAWEELLDVGDLIGCVPGARMKSLGDGVYRGAIDESIDGTRIACSATLRPIDTDLDERRASFRIRGRETAGPAIGGGWRSAPTWRSSATGAISTRWRRAPTSCSIALPAGSRLASRSARAWLPSGRPGARHARPRRNARPSSA